jgi:ribose transport system substrate-binding protein
MRKLILAFSYAVLSGLISTSSFAAEKKFTIGLSNGWVGGWRTQMIDEAVEAGKKWKDSGVDVKVIVQSKTEDIQGQIATIKNFIQQKVDAIVVNPNSPTALSPVFAQAKKAGILVLATDGEVTSKDAIFVGIDQKGLAEQSMQWLADKLGGKGSIVVIHGIAGHPANQARVAGVNAILAKYPNIKVLNEANADWDNSKSQQVMKTLLATYPNVDGVWVTNGCADGVRRALTDAGKNNIPATAELSASFMKKWKEQGFQAADCINPPGCMANAVNVAVLLLQGHKLKEGALTGPNGNDLYIPLKLVSNENMKEYYPEIESKPDYIWVSQILPPDEWQKLAFQ